ncbi:MAG TPA: YceI family protein [Gemmatimonadaceae bacterium]|nr:YceI family protein [Gemmatimonadaceae bacterium]
MAEHRAIRLTAANTRISFAVRWLGALTVRGRFTSVDGLLRIPDGCVEASSITIDIESASLRTGIAMRDRHLRGPRFLDAGRHPLISFRSTRIERPNSVLVATGRLTLHGHEHELTAICPLDYASGAGMQSLVRIGAEFRVRRSLYGIGAARGLRGLNPLLRAIGDEVSLHAEVLVPATQLLPALLPALGH